MQANVVVPGNGRRYVDGDGLDLSEPLVFTIADVLARDECGALIARIEAANPTAAPITTARGFVMRPDVRNNTRVIFDDVELARRLYARIESAVPPLLAGMYSHGANERFRCYRYEPGQRFAPHYDGSFRRSEREESQLTLMVYLNEGFVGGATAFHDFGVEVVPVTGMALLFQHRVLHEGCEVVEGTKYVLRSDVMFRTSPSRRA
jgi:prolyl 4-hydroxylase